MQASLRPIPEQSIIALTDIARAGENIAPEAINRIVMTSGRYEKVFTAPGQRPMQGNGKRSTQVLTLDVRLLRISEERGILVVRGIAENSTPEILQQVKISGRLYPRQNSDVTSPSDGSLSRLDPALVAGLTSLKLFDGYIVVKSETTADNEPIFGERLPTPQLISRVGGYYWQHISYVVIWWLMALLVWALPLISRKYQRNPSHDSASKIR